MSLFLNHITYKGHQRVGWALLTTTHTCRLQVTVSIFSLLPSSFSFSSFVLKPWFCSPHQRIAGNKACLLHSLLLRFAFLLRLFGVSVFSSPPRLQLFSCFCSGFRLSSLHRSAFVDVRGNSNNAGCYLGIGQIFSCCSKTNSPLPPAISSPETSPERHIKTRGCRNSMLTEHLHPLEAVLKLLMTE
ncbi:uncharacterized protein LOC142531260 [Primulina tabacum]|uniref:uncharacterized protein LOC142531260 n=1 Tax=Primulina tabacum TaxID=48773 RepID=UPI003F5A2955